MTANTDTTGIENQPTRIVVESELDAFLIAQEAWDLAGVVALGSVSARPDKRTAEILRSSLHMINALDYDRVGARARQ